MDEFVVGIDGSDHSRLGLRWAATVADAVGVSVRAIQSWMDPRWTMMALAPPPVSDEAMQERSQEELDALIVETLGSSATVKAEVAWGSAAAILLSTVTPDSVLVLGSRGLGGFTGLLLGSVSQECVEYASSPVVVVRTEHQLSKGELILVGSDGSEGAQRAFEWARTLASAVGADVRVVRAVHGTKAEPAPQIGDEIEVVEMEGDPRHVLLHAAERFTPALTVVGRRGAGGLRSMRFGSTANHLVRHGGTNVAVIPVPDEDDDDD